MYGSERFRKSEIHRTHYTPHVSRQLQVFSPKIFFQRASQVAKLADVSFDSSPFFKLPLTVSREQENADRLQSRADYNFHILFYLLRE